MIGTGELHHYLGSNGTTHDFCDFEVSYPTGDDDQPYVLEVCGQPATWLHIVKLDVSLEPTDAPDHQVTVRRYCSEHGTDAMAMDAQDPIVVEATYKPL